MVIASSGRRLKEGWPFILQVVLVALSSGCSRAPVPVESGEHRKSTECRACHPGFYKRWSTSSHGLAMQPFTTQLARARFQPHTEAMRIGAAAYRANFDGERGFIEEDGPQGRRKFPIVQVMGGKNTYYLLTPMERGRLQVLPLAYDLQTNKWYDMAASGVRVHNGVVGQAALAWTDAAFTFNTSCYGCHTSQIQTNYDSASDSYSTTWQEPGINCETCHGGAAEHVRVMKTSAGGKTADLRILQIAGMNATQRTEMCAPCHAKMSPLSAGYQATQRFFDHYDLVTLESSDFYPDGRDLGENYTYTSWLLGSCNKNQKLDCLHCHTSTGAFRFATNNSDLACTTCHQDVAAKGERHSHHKAESSGARCIGCHMPKTRFANMSRSDHSFLPPTPAATVQFQSPNACNVCHKDKGAEWADALVGKWYKPGYQQPVVDRAALIEAARRRDWNRAPAMIAYLRDPNGRDIFKASLLRLLRAWTDARKARVFGEQLQSGSPLVRAAAAAGLAGEVSNGEALRQLMTATADKYRVVRIRAAASMAGLAPVAISGEMQQQVRKATAELEASFTARADDYNGQTNLGNFYLRRGDVKLSLEAFERAIRLRPDSVGTLVNASVAYSRASRSADAERVLRQAAHYAPQNAAVLFNLGLLFAESGRTAEAEAALGTAFELDPTMAAAGYNLAILVSGKDLKQAVALCRKAVAISAEPKYVKALAQFLAKDGQIAEAKRVFETLKR